MSQLQRVRTSPAHQHHGDSLAAPATVGQGVCTSRTHIDAHGTPVVAGCNVSVLGARPVKVQRLHGEGQFVFLRAGVEVTQFCCTAKVLPAPITGQSGAWITWPQGIAA